MEPRNEQLPYDVTYIADWLTMIDDAEGTGVDWETSEALREHGHEWGEDETPFPDPYEWDWADWLAEGDAQAMRAELAALQPLAEAARWVPVNEGAPQPREAYPRRTVIALLQNGTHVEALHDEGAWYEWDSELNDWIPLAGITHWFRVPPSPTNP